MYSRLQRSYAGKSCSEIIDQFFNSLYSDRRTLLSDIEKVNGIHFCQEVKQEDITGATFLLEGEYFEESWILMDLC